MSIEAMKLALEALETAESFDIDAHDGYYLKAITALRQTIEQAQNQDPVSWESILGAVARGWCYEENANKTMDSELAVAIAKEVQALYTSPPQRQWVGLTNEEVREIYGIDWDYKDGDYARYARAIEAKLKEKNT